MRFVIGRNKLERFFAFGGLHSLILSFYFCQFYLDWPLLKLSKIRGQFNFEDFVTIFTSANCFREIGLQIYIPDATRPLCFYPYGRTFIYFIDLFRIPASLAPTIIILVAVLIMYLVIKYLGKTSPIEKTIIFFVFISPPLWLATERGNADMLICLLVLIAAYLSYKNHHQSSILLLALATLIKFYTLPLLIIEVWRRRTYINKYISVSLLVSICYVIIIDIQAQHLQQPGSFAFGSPVVTFWINALSTNLGLPIGEVGIKLGQLIGIMVLSLVAATLSRYVAPSFKPLKLKGESLSQICLFYLGSVYVTCFVLGMSYDYRLIFSALAGLFFMRTYASFDSRRLWVMLFWLLSLWLSVFNFGLSPKNHLLIQWIGNIFDFFTAGLIIALFASQFKIGKFRITKNWGIANE